MSQPKLNLLIRTICANLVWVAAAMVLIVVIPVPLLQGADSSTTKEQPAKTNSSVSVSGANKTQTIAADTKAAEPLFTDSEWQRQQTTSETPTTGGAVIGQAAMGLLLSLGIIAGLAWALAWASKRFGMRRVMPGRGQHVQVIETVPLGFKRAISLVRIHDQVLVIGQGEHELCHLATLPANALTSVLAETPAPTETKIGNQNVVEVASTSAPQSSAFRQLLDSMGGRRS